MEVVASTDTTVALIAAAAALGGALIGGVITTGATWWFEHKRDQADLRQARRLVAEELRTVHMHMEMVVAETRYPTNPNVMGMGFFPIAQWEAHRGVLARHVSDDTWDVLAPCLDSVPPLRALFAAGQPGAPLPPGVLARITRTAELSAAVYRRLTGSAIDTT